MVTADTEPFRLVCEQNVSRSPSGRPAAVWPADRDSVASFPVRGERDNLGEIVKDAIPVDPVSIDLSHGRGANEVTREAQLKRGAAVGVGVPNLTGHLHISPVPSVPSASDSSTRTGPEGTRMNPPLKPHHGVAD